MNQLKNVSTEELNAKVKSLNMMTNVLGIIKVILYAVCIYGIMTNENKTIYLIVIAIAFALTFFISKNLKKKQKINRILRSRHGE